MISIENLTKTYGAIRAVDGLSLEIEAGEIFGLLGPNGAGKTTTIKLLTTLARPDSGRMTIAGRDVSQRDPDVKRLIGVVPQEINLDRELSILENLEVYARLHGVTDSQPKIRRTLETVGLWERRDSLVQGLSGGMKRRLLIARAMLPEPEILFLDEPSIGLDPQIRRQMWDLIRQISLEGRTVIITTHYIEEAEALCDRVGIMSHGRLVVVDTPANLKTQVGPYVMEHIDESGKLLQEICADREAANQRAALFNNRVTVRRTNLEDVFIKLTGERIE